MIDAEKLFFFMATSTGLGPCGRRQRNPNAKRAEQKILRSFVALEILSREWKQPPLASCAD
jgi:hypothetical protein